MFRVSERPSLVLAGLAGDRSDGCQFCRGRKVRTMSFLEHDGGEGERLVGMFCPG